MKLADKLHESLSRIMNEKLITPNGGKKEGQVVFLAGGAASGKSFAIDYFMDTKIFKTFDVDALKQRLIKLAQIKGDNPEIANLDLGKQADVFKLHTYVEERGLSDKMLNNFLSNIKASKGLPNIIFDVTMKNDKKLVEMSDRLIGIGYKPENIHVVWALADFDVAFINNRERPRVVPEDILFITHKGAAVTMQQLMAGKLPRTVDGEVHVIMSDPKITQFEKDPEGNQLKFTSPMTGKQSFVVKDFMYVKVKESGKRQFKDDVIKKVVYDWAKNSVPKEIRSRFS